MSPLSRRFVLTGAAVTTASLLVPITMGPAGAAARRGEEEYEITDWIIIAPSARPTSGCESPSVTCKRGRAARSVGWSCEQQQIPVQVFDNEVSRPPGLLLERLKKRNTRRLKLEEELL